MEQNTVTLDTPIQRGEQTITTITLRKPKAGELRGINAADVLQLNVDALIKLLPRITSPVLTEHDITNMDPADLVQFGTEVAGFLVPRRMAYLQA